ncbi:hypothetical protein B0A48_15630 [Cryoendolithus antarcticus]|uniref:Uncharacterized protein n=1 Tax=Cryoendolithus antarcticus TaxID=1507870 RepID=A0A1V8SGZ7_9PEZI|nr:hypothetical protein B0A48_15630 [Cryoendolithus antarcticus]
MAIGDVAWNVTIDRPIIDGKTINPETGSQNLHIDPETDVWVLNRGLAGPSIDKFFIRVAKLVQDGWITLHSGTVTQYTCVVVCESKATRDEFHRVAWNSGAGPAVLE